MVTGWLNRSQNQRLQLFKVAIANGQVHTKTIPKLSMTVSEVMLEPISQVFGQSDVVEFVFTIEGVNPLASSDVASDYILIFTQRLMGNVFQVLADQLSLPCHTLSPELAGRLYLGQAPFYSFVKFLKCISIIQESQRSGGPPC